MNTRSRQVVVVELDVATVRRLNRLAKRLAQTRASLLRLWILAQLEATEGHR